MKTGITFLGVFFILVIVSILLKREIDEHITTTEITVMRDITDVLVSQPTLTDISSLLNPENSIWDGSNFRFIDISDVSYNHTSETRIPAENPLLGNELDRIKKVKQFKEEVSDILENAGFETMNKNNSSIYRPIASELNRLSQSSAEHKYLLIYSDLAENTEEFSVYKDSDFELLQSKPDLVRQYFEKQAKLKNLKGIKVFLIYQPKNRNSDNQYNIISAFYTKLLEDSGAKVEISANIN